MEASDRQAIDACANGHGVEITAVSMPTACLHQLAALKLISCRSRENCRHQLRCSLTSARRLSSKLAINGWRERNAGDNERPWRQHARGELLLEYRIELPHALPFLSGRQFLEFRNHGTVGCNDDIRQLG